MTHFSTPIQAGSTQWQHTANYLLTMTLLIQEPSCC